jgi:hypothetical protein
MLIWKTYTKKWEPIKDREITFILFYYI